MNDKINIRKSPDADTRSSEHIITKEELEKSTMMHISDVSKALCYFAYKLENAGYNHDWTKMKYIDEFYKQFHKAQITGEWGDGWYDEIHVVKERHHFNENIPDDVDLIDVLEQIADGVMAGMARNGKYTYEKLPDGLLEKAYKNTIKKLINKIKVIE